MRPRTPVESVAAAVGDLAGALRRRREAREPYVRVHDAAGRVRTLDPDDLETQALLDAAEAMVDAVDARTSEPQPADEARAPGPQAIAEVDADDLDA
jgi:hypothetical protein